MRNFKTLFFSLVVALFFVACDGEDDSIKPAEDFLLGTWELTEIGSLNANNTQVFEPVFTEGNCGFDTFTFGANNLLTITIYTSETADNCDTYIDSGSFSRDNAYLDLFYTLEGETTATSIYATIQALTLEELVLTYSENGEIVLLKFSKM